MILGIVAGQERKVCPNKLSTLSVRSDKYFKNAWTVHVVLFNFSVLVRSICRISSFTFLVPVMLWPFQKGDFRSGYYRDQTFMMSLDLCSVQDYFAQLYADTENDKFSKGRQMNAHFATALIQ